MSTFHIIAALMIAIALAFIVVPLLRRHSPADPALQRIRALDAALANGVISNDEYAAKRAAFEPSTVTSATPSRTGFVAVVLTVLILPAAAILLYARYGTPQALDPAVTQPISHDATGGVDMNQAVAGLVAKLDKSPDDAQGWALLGRAYLSMQKPQEALQSLKRAHELLPDDPDLMAEYAQTLVMAGQRDFSGEPKALIDRALTLQPDNQRALWLRGVAEYQAGQYETAIATWTRLQGLLPAGSSVASSVQAQIDDARGKAGLPVAPSYATASAPATPPSTSAPVTAAATPAVAGQGPKLTISVKLDPKLVAAVPKDATLFVFARAASGPPMPLAIQRLVAGQLPLTLTLDDSNGMMPNLKLSMFPQVVIGARISRSGDPIAKTGDWQTLSAPVDVQRREPIELTIDQIVP